MAGISSENPVRVGLFGLGTVGQSLVKILDSGNYPIEIVRIVDRSYQKKMELIENRPNRTASDNPADILEDDSIDLVVEAMGGVDQPLYIIREALDKNKNVVTANKFLLAEHGYALFTKAQSNNLKIGFEAAVAGALPIIRNIENIFLYEKIDLLEGILNGTTNYILTRMRKEKLDYADVLEDAQRLGLAEADPTLDINGMDAVHKLALLSSLLSKKWVDYHKVYVRGIENIRLADVVSAEKMGYRIRQVSRYQNIDDHIFVTVEPSLISPSHYLWEIEMENNAVMFKGEYSGDHLFVGKGAGGFPTAYSVLSDIMHYVQGNYNALGAPGFSWKYANISPELDKRTSFYLRIVVDDKTGVLTKITGLLSQSQISIASVHQDTPHNQQEAEVDLIIVTHPCLRRDFEDAVKKLNTINEVKKEPVFLPIDEA